MALSMDARFRHVPPRVEQIVRFVTEYVDEHGYSPTVREVVTAVGLSSSGSVNSHIREAVRHGLLTQRGKEATRTLRPVREHCRLCGRP